MHVDHRRIKAWFGDEVNIHSLVGDNVYLCNTAPGRFAADNDIGRNSEAALDITCIACNRSVGVTVSPRLVSLDSPVDHRDGTAPEESNRRRRCRKGSLWSSTAGFRMYSFRTSEKRCSQGQRKVTVSSQTFEGVVSPVSGLKNDRVTDVHDSGPRRRAPVHRDHPPPLQL